DPPAPLAAQVGNHRSGEPHRAVEVDVEAGLPLVVGGVERAAEPGVTGIVHEAVDATEVLEGGGDHPLDTRGGGDVRLHAERIHAVGPQPGDGGVERVRAPSADADSGALPGELVRDRPADSPARGGDEGDL